MFSRLHDKVKDPFVKDSIKDITGSALSLVLMIINGAIGLALIFTSQDAIMRFIWEHFTFWSWRFIGASAAIILTICWVAGILVLQHLYEKDFKLNWMRALVRFGIVLAVQLVLYQGTVWYAFRPGAGLFRLM